MNQETVKTTSPAPGGSALASGGSASQTTAAPLSPRQSPHVTKPPVVRATLVRPAPVAVVTDPSDDEVSAIRAVRRRELFHVYFQHQEGTMRDKRAQVYAILDRVRDPDERDKLHDFFKRLVGIAQSVPPGLP